jgi:hypothetical protein
MCPRGGHPRPEMLKVASLIASGHWGRVPIASRVQHRVRPRRPKRHLG